RQFWRCSKIIESYLFHDQLVTKFVTKLVDTSLVTTLVIKVYDQFKNVTLLDPKSKSNYYEKKSQEISEASEDFYVGKKSIKAPTDPITNTINKQNKNFFKSNYLTWHVNLNEWIQKDQSF
ncbi:hypothetical protein BpHYR1_038075, partial [Brachionus plicatilis]